MPRSRNPDDLPRFHPLTPLRRWEGGAEFQIVHAQSGVLVTGATGSGKTSGPAKNLAIGYLAAGMGGCVLCSKAEEAQQWREWAREARREKDLVVIDGKGTWRFNFLNWEAGRQGEGGGLTINIVALLDELAQAIAGGAGKAEGGGDSKFFDDALHHMNTNLVDLALLAGVGVSLPVLRSILISAPLSPQEAESEEWQTRSNCYLTINAADKRTVGSDPDTRADFEECRTYWMQEFPALSERTRSIIQLSFSMLGRPFITRPLRRLFSSDTNIRPEDAFDGKIIVIDLPVQTYRLAGRVANLVWKYCFQVAALCRTQPTNGTYLRPVFLWADEYQNFISPFDFMFASVCRSASACMAVMVQNRESLIAVLGNDAMVDSLCSNLSNKFFCQNSGTTNAWASRLIGEQWVRVQGISTNRQALAVDAHGASAGVSFHDELRRYCDEGVFGQLRRGGELNDFKVDVIVHGPLFGDEPYRLVTFNQR
jgi:hypothetical protein